MAQRRYWRRRRPESFEDVLAPLVGFLSLGIVAYVLTHTAQVIASGLAFLGVVIAASVIYFVYKTRKRPASLNWDDDKILYMLKGMSSAQFEEEVAEMFRGLGYDAEVVGGETTAASMSSRARTARDTTSNARSSPVARLRRTMYGTSSARSRMSTTRRIRATL